jgi:tellurite resistance protein
MMIKEPARSSELSAEQTLTWLRGLLTVAWADGHFDPPEQSLIEDFMRQKHADDLPQRSFDPIAAPDLAASLGRDRSLAENFLRTAVMVGLADGVYSTTEDQVLHQFCTALNLEIAALDALRLTLDGQHDHLHPDHHAYHLLEPMQHWLDGMEIHDPKIAHFLCKLIPPQCPFERDITLFGHKLVHIPPMCKLNPLYEQLVGLRFRALSYLADDCQEDISAYI